MTRTAEMILGVIGGIFGIIAGVFAITVGGLGSAFGVSDAGLVAILGFGAILLGLLGLVGGAIVNKNNKVAGGLMLSTGILGFIAISAFWILAGILLIIGGILAIRTKDEDIQH